MGSAAAAVLAVLLTGTVVAPDGSPIAGVRIRVASDSASTITVADGSFTLADVILPVDLIVDAPGFAERRLRATVSPVRIVLLPRAADASVLVEAPSAPPGAFVFTRDALSQTPAASLDERLRSVAGLSLFRRTSARTANPTTHGVTMRGLSASGASRGLVLLDGVPLNDGFGGWVTWTRVPGDALDRVDVVSGAAGDMFGTDALGGVIRLQSAVPVRPIGRVSIESGSRATHAADVSGGRPAGPWSWFGAASGFRSGGAVPLAGELTGPVDRPADAEWVNGFARVERRVAAWQVSAFGLVGRDDRGNGTVLQRNRMSGGTGAVSMYAASATTTAALRVAVSRNGFDQTFSAVVPARTSESLTSTQDISSTTIRVSSELGRSAARMYGLVRASVARATADFREVRPGAPTSDQSLRDDGESLSAQVGWTASRGLTFGGGIRQEWRAAPGADAGRDTARVGRLTLEWRGDRALSARGSAATSHRWPTLNELVRGFRVGAQVTNANPDLRPERAQAFEAGLRLRQPGVTMGATAFHTTVRDAIVNVTVATTPSLVRQRQNAGTVTSTGVEIDATWQVVPPVRLRTSLQWVDAQLQGLRVPQVPAVSGTFAADLTAGRMSAHVIVRSTGHQFDDDRNVFRLAAATQVDARAQVRLPGTSLFVIGENLFDARVETGRTPLITLAPGRALRAGVQLLLGDLRR